MKDNIFKGKLIAIDGPNGAGKSTLIKCLKNELEKGDYKVYITKEPTETELGGFVRQYAEKNKGMGLACLVAADRYEHINQEIIPQLQEGKIVITDRYLLSSLILQRMDGVESEFICNIHDEIIKPDLQIAVFADEKVICKRLLERDELTRFEKNNQSQYELAYLEEGISILKEQNVHVISVINNDELEKNVKKIAFEIAQL